ncbi:MAG: hypothetical protein ACOX4G_01245 [Limnochordia bacterium]
MKSRLTRTTVGFILVLASALVLFTPKSLATMPLGDGDDDASVGVNLLANPGFEKEMDGWRRNFANRGAVHELDEANARKGERSLRFSSLALCASSGSQHPCCSEEAVNDGLTIAPVRKGKMRMSE